MARAAALEFAHRQGVDARLNHAALQIEIANRVAGPGRELRRYHTMRFTISARSPGIMSKLTCAARTRGTAPLKVFKILVQRLPGYLVFKPDFTVGWKRFGRVKRCGCHINRIRTLVVLIR